MKVLDVMQAIERIAPLQLQEEFDNSGLQLGAPGAEVHKVLTCLDITEDIVSEAISRGCDMIVSHHPLLYHPLKQVSDAAWQQRCVVSAIKEGIAVYSAHTSLDIAPGGVNHRLAELIGLQQLEWLEPKPGMDGGSGLVGKLPEPMEDRAFLSLLKARFSVECLRHTEPSGRSISKVAVCGGSGGFLLKDALRLGADCFVTGEFHYHDFFDNEGMLLAELGHYQSERCTVSLLRELIEAALPGLAVVETRLNTNAIRYDSF